MKPIPRSQFLPRRDKYNTFYVYNDIRGATNPAANLLFQEVLPEVLEMVWQQIQADVDEIINGPFIFPLDKISPDQGIYHTLFRHTGY